MASILLAVDVGGTKCELAAYPATGGQWQPLAQKRYASGEFTRLEDIIRLFIQEFNITPEYASIGVAGVVRNNVGSVTNLPWTVDKQQIAAAFEFKGVVLLNDLTAVCASLSLLGPDDVFEIQAGQHQPDQVIGVVAPGTGMGEGFLMQSGDFFFPRGSEGGHADFAPVDSLQAELLSWMMEREEQVSYESLIAGPGIPNLYDFFHLKKGLKETDHVRVEMEKARDRTPIIFNNGVGENSCPLCRLTIELFLSILGSEAGNLALKLYAGGGIYIGGGIVPRIAKQISFEGFLKAFHNKGKMSDLMHTFPIHLILKKDAALLGTARYGRELLVP